MRELLSSFIHWIQDLQKKNTLRKFPLKDHLSGYNSTKLQVDARAGLNVALLAFPQGMAYALIAGLPVQYGIFCSIAAPIIGAMLSSSRVTVLGPTNATAAMVFSTLVVYQSSGEILSAIPILTVMIGVFLVIGAYFQVANLTQYVSRTVIIGYITGAAFFIVSKQLRHLLQIDQGEGQFFYNAIFHVVEHLHEAHLPSLFLSLFTFCLFVFLSQSVPQWPRAAIALIVCSIIGVVMARAGSPVTTLNSVSLADFDFSLPAFNLDLFSELLSGALAIAFLASIENTFMAKSLASRFGEKIDVNQEMLSLGAANLVSGIFSGMPASGSLTRSALNVTSGAVTPLSSIVNGLVGTLMVLGLGSLIHYIPTCSLAVVVMITAFSLIRPQDIRICLRSTGSDAAVLITTFVAALLAPLNEAIFMGVALSIVLFLRKASMPQLVEYAFTDEGNLAEKDEKIKRSHPAISIIHVEGELFFGAADLFRDHIRLVGNEDNLKVVILRMRNARHLDATSVMALAELIRFLRDRGRYLLVSGASREVYRVLYDSGVLELLERKNFFPTSSRNPNLSTKKALQRAQTLLGQKSVDIRIFVNKKEEE